MDIKPDGVHSLDPCQYALAEVHKNVDVYVNVCRVCGHVEITWARTNETKDIIEDQELSDRINDKSKILIVREAAEEVEDMKAIEPVDNHIDAESKAGLAKFFLSLTDREKELVSASIEWTRASARNEPLDIPPEARNEWSKMVDGFYKWQYKVYNTMLQKVVEDEKSKNNQAGETAETTDETEN